MHDPSTHLPIVLASLLVLGCFEDAGSDPVAEDAEDCRSLGLDCGDFDHDGDTLHCGDCSSGEVCGINGAANLCCEPTSCAAAGVECGMISDGCTDVLDCGACDGADTGGDDGSGSGECTPTSCSAEGADCGTLNDGCNGVLDCGGCSGGATCGGGGMPFVCGVPTVGVAPEEATPDCLAWPATSSNFIRQTTFVAAGDSAVEFTLQDVDGATTSLSDLLATKPVMLQTVSFTCPAANGNIDNTERLAAQYGDRVHFVSIYTPEAHPLIDVSPYNGRLDERGKSDYRQATSYAERVEAARGFIDVGVERVALLIDTFGAPGSDVFWCTYMTRPNGAVLIDRSGRITAVQDWFDEPTMADAIDALL